MSSLARRRAIAAIVLIVVCGAAWYAAQPQTPASQPPLVTFDTSSLAAFRDAFNGDADQVRIVMLQSPT